MGLFNKKPKMPEGLHFIREGKKVKVVQVSFERNDSGKIVEVTTESFHRPTDRKLQKMAEKEFKEKGSVYYNGTIQKKGDLKHMYAGLAGVFKGPVQKGSQNIPVKDRVHPSAVKDYLKRNPKQELGFIPSRNDPNYIHYLDHEMKRQGLG